MKNSTTNTIEEFRGDTLASRGLLRAIVKRIKDLYALI